MKVSTKSKHKVAKRKPATPGKSNGNGKPAAPVTYHLQSDAKNGGIELQLHLQLSIPLAIAAVGFCREFGKHDNIFVHVERSLLRAIEQHRGGVL